MSDTGLNRSRLLKKLPKLRERALEYGFSANITIDPSFVPNELIPLIPYAEIVAGDWVTAEAKFREFDGNAPDELWEDLRSNDLEVRSVLAEYVQSLRREPVKQLDHLSNADIQRLHDLYYPKGWKYQSAWFLEAQSVEYHAWSDLQMIMGAARFQKVSAS